MPRNIDVDLRKAELAEAAIQVIDRSGISALTIPAVAEEAGISTKCLRHVFPTRSDVLTGTAQHLITEVENRIIAHVERYRKEQSSLPQGQDHETRQRHVIDLAVECLKEVLSLDSDRRTEMIVHIALVAESSAEPTLMRIRNEMNRGVHDVCVLLAIELFGCGPHSYADEDLQLAAMTLHVIADGLAHQLLHQDPAADTQWAIDFIRARVERIAANHMRTLSCA